MGNKIKIITILIVAALIVGIGYVLLSGQPTEKTNQPVTEMPKPSEEMWDGQSIPWVEPGSMTVDGNPNEWKNVPDFLKLDTVDVGLDESYPVPEAQWKLNQFRIAWDGENIYFSYDVKDSLVVWGSKSDWWAFDCFELFMSSNTYYKKDMLQLKNSELETDTEGILQVYMTGGEASGLYADRTVQSAVDAENQYQLKLIETDAGYIGEGRIPLATIPSLREKIIQQKPVKLAVHFKEYNGGAGVGINASITNVDIPAQNKLRPAFMEDMLFYIPQAQQKALMDSIVPAGGGSQTAMPEKVTGFSAAEWPNVVSLSWVNPEKNFAGTRIVRSTEGFPQTPEDGDTVYDGVDAVFMDKKEVPSTKGYYYSAFSYNSGKEFAAAAQAYAGPDKTLTGSDTITIDRFMGTNAFIDDPLDKMQAVGIIREYHTWQWDESMEEDYKGYPNNLNKWNPSYAGAEVNYWNFDTYYKNLFEAGIEVFPCVQGTPKYLSGSDDFFYNGKPVSKDESTTDPKSYAEHADHMYQYAARYGSMVVPDENLKLASDQPRVSGLGYIKYFENWNEPDKTWGVPEGHFTPQELAAMCSADYDGHMGTMGKTVGIKNADPNAKLVMGGLAGLQISYLREMLAWSKENRNGSFPADVINLHTYCTDSLRGISPEEDRLMQKLQKVNAFREIHLPDKELWLSEVGYDTHPKSTQMAKDELTQAQWILRSYLAVLGARVDRCAQYMLRDVNPNSKTQYDTSGLVGPKGDWTPKPSWYFVYTMKNVLKNMILDAALDSGNENVYLFRCKDIHSDKGAYILWCPTSDGTMVNDYELSLMDYVKKASVVQPTDGSTTGVSTALSISNGKVKVNVSETPVFVVFE